MTKQKYWCLLADAFPESTVVSDNPILTSPVEFVDARRKGDLIVLGRWDATAKIGHVSALGIVTEAGLPGIRVEWRTVRLHKSPHSNGRRHWLKAFFLFDDEVAAGWQFARHFAEQFPELEPPSPKPTA